MYASVLNIYCLQTLSFFFHKSFLVNKTTLILKQYGKQSMLIDRIKTKVVSQENEKLYLQMKTQQAKSKANEEAMFSENQRLLNELTFTRWV